MYAFIDRELNRLGTGEQVLVRALRDWVMAAKRGRCPVDAVALRFVSHRLVGALEPFNTAMELLARHGRPRLEFACPCHPRVSEGEAILLAAFLGTQERGVGCRTAHLVPDPEHGAFAQAVGAFEAATIMAGLR